MKWLRARLEVSKQRQKAERSSSRPQAYALNNISEEVGYYEALIEIVEGLPEDYAPPALSEREVARVEAKKRGRPRRQDGPSEATTEV